MKNIKLKSIITLISASAAFANAQEAGAPLPAPSAAQPVAAAMAEKPKSPYDSSPEALADISNNAKKSAQDYLDAKGISLGFDNGKFYAIGTAGISVKSTDPKFADMRVNAYSKAMLDAKEQISRFVKSQISTEVMHKYGESTQLKTELDAQKEADARKNASLFGKIEYIINDKIDQMLKADGVDLDSPEARAKAQKLLNSDEFQNFINITSQRVIGGLVCSKIFEENENMAVVAYFSDNTQELAKAISGKGPAPKVTPRKGSLKDWVKTLTPENLCPAFGVQLAADEEGNLVILSYGQAVAQSTSKNAIRNAQTASSTYADAYIRQFAGELVSYENASGRLEKTNEFKDGTEILIGNFSDVSIKAVANALEIQGIYTLRTWETKDLRNGSFIVGTIRAWSIKSAGIAKNLEEGKAMSAPKAVPGTEKSASEKYKIESIESEDF